MATQQNEWEDLCAAFDRCRLLMEAIAKDDAWARKLTPIPFIKGSGPERNVFQYFEQIIYLIQHADTIHIGPQEMAQRLKSVRAMELFMLFYKPD